MKRNPFQELSYDDESEQEKDKKALKSIEISYEINQHVIASYANQHESKLKKLHKKEK